MKQSPPTPHSLFLKGDFVSSSRIPCFFPRLVGSNVKSPLHGSGNFQGPHCPYMGARSRGQPGSMLPGPLSFSIRPSVTPGAHLGMYRSLIKLSCMFFKNTFVLYFGGIFVLSAMSLERPGFIVSGRVEGFITGSCDIEFSAFLD